MRFGAKRMIWALCAGPAVAATLITGASAASAAVITPVPNSGLLSVLTAQAIRTATGGSLSGGT